MTRVQAGRQESAEEDDFRSRSARQHVLLTGSETVVRHYRYKTSQNGMDGWNGVVACLHLKVHVMIWVLQKVDFIPGDWTRHFKSSESKSLWKLKRSQVSGPTILLFGFFIGNWWNKSTEGRFISALSQEVISFVYMKDERKMFGHLICWSSGDLCFQIHLFGCLWRFSITQVCLEVKRTCRLSVYIGYLIVQPPNQSQDTVTAHRYDSIPLLAWRVHNKKVCCCSLSA